MSINNTKSAIFQSKKEKRDKKSEKKTLKCDSMCNEKTNDKGLKTPRWATRALNMESLRPAKFPIHKKDVCNYREILFAERFVWLIG